MTEPSRIDAVGLVEAIARMLVDKSDEVFVEQFDERGETVVELEVAEDEMGRVIGRGGRTAKALRAMLAAAGAESGKRYTLEIVE